MANPSKAIVGALVLISCFYKLVSSDHIRSFGCILSKNASVSYQNNLNILFSDFISQSSQQGFYNTSIGSRLDTVFGYYVCRGDFSPEACQNCIINATQMAQGSDCLKNKEAGFLSTDCIFRYSNRSMYGVWENITGINSPIGMNLSGYNQGNYRLYNRTLTSMVEDLIEEASSTDNSSSLVLGFATKETNVTGDEKIYGLAQCTPDIVEVNCSRCLRSAFSDLQASFNGYEGAEYATYNCLLIYSNLKFYEDDDSSKGEGLRPPNLVVIYSLLSLYVLYLPWSWLDL